MHESIKPKHDAVTNRRCPFLLKMLGCYVTKGDKSDFYFSIVRALNLKVVIHKRLISISINYIASLIVFQKHPHPVSSVNNQLY